MTLFLHQMWHCNWKFCKYFNHKKYSTWIFRVHSLLLQLIIKSMTDNYLLCFGFLSLLPLFDHNRTDGNGGSPKPLLILALPVCEFPFQQQSTNNKLFLHQCDREFTGSESKSESGSISSWSFINHWEFLLKFGFPPSYSSIKALSLYSEADTREHKGLPLGEKFP